MEPESAGANCNSLQKPEGGNSTPQESAFRGWGGVRQMSYGAYAVGVGLLVAAIMPLVAGAVSLRARLLPEWTGAPARVADAVLTLSALLVAAELVGILGLFQRVPLILVCAALGLGEVVVARRLPSQTYEETNAPPARPRFEYVVAIGVALVVAVQWGPGTVEALQHGMLGTDTLRYHGPIAARFVQEHSITSLHFISTEAVVAYFPFNSELLHSVGMLLLGSDLVSPMLNLGWLALALASAWSISRPAGLGVMTLTAGALVLASPSLTAQAGGGDTDTVAVALLLAAVAVLVNGRLRPAPLAIAGLAAGLAVGTKLTVIGAVLTLTLGVFVLAGRQRRLRLGGAWLGALVVTGGFWYLRNLVVLGNPLPWFHVSLGPVSVPGLTAYKDVSIAHYATKPSIWSDWFFPGLHDALGSAWWALLAGGLLGAALMVVRPRSRLHRWLGLAGVIAFIAYVFTPGSAAGAQDLPVAFSAAVRFLAPALAIGLCLFPLLPQLESVARRPAFLIALGVILLMTVGRRFPDQGTAPTVVLVAASLLGAAGFLWALQRYVGRVAVVIATTLLLVGVAFGPGWALERGYTRDRYANTAYAWAQPLRHARIALAGTSWQYGLYGRRLSNHVQFVGRRTGNGGYRRVGDCREWRQAINSGDYDYVVAAAGNFLGGRALEEPREVEWTGGDPHAKAILERDDVTVFRLTGKLDLQRACRWQNRLHRGPSAIISERLTTISRCLRGKGYVTRRTLTPGSARYSARKVQLSGTRPAIVYAFASARDAAAEVGNIDKYFRAGNGHAQRVGTVIIGYASTVDVRQRKIVEGCL